MTHVPIVKKKETQTISNIDGRGSTIKELNRTQQSFTANSQNLL